VVDGVHFAMGYSGHGAQLSTLMGTRLAAAMCGGPLELPFADLDWPPIPAHFARAWTLPLVGLYYRALDLVR
jgi:glycine/D-amino acid oxidase-like deaminating enzyme